MNDKFQFLTECELRIQQVTQSLVAPIILKYIYFPSEKGMVAFSRKPTVGKLGDEVLIWVSLNILALSCLIKYRNILDVEVD